MTRPWWLLAFPALVVVAFPSLALYLGALGSAAAIVGLGLAGYRFHNERDEARTERDHLEAECNEHAAVSASLAHENASLHARLAELEPVPVELTPKALEVTRPDLHIVAPVADESWLDEITKPGGWA